VSDSESTQLIKEKTRRLSGIETVQEEELKKGKEKKQKQSI